MVAEFSVYDTPLLAVEHLFDSEENESLISRFTAPNNAMGLESYLKNSMHGSVCGSECVIHICPS